MEITQEKLDKLFSIYEELDALNAEATDAINLAKRNAGNRFYITRSNGKEQQVTEQMLWDEVWTLGADSDAGKHLAKKYPLAFGKSEEAKKKRLELSAFTMAELGMDAQAVRLSDIIRLVDALLAYRLKTNGNIGDTAKA